MPSSRLTIDQRKMLTEKINRALRELRENIKLLDDPPAIKDARKTIDLWDNKQYKLRRTICNRLEKRARILREIVLFADPYAAKKLVDRFEKTGK